MGTFYKADGVITSPLPGAPVYLPPVVLQDVPVSGYSHQYAAETLQLIHGDKVASWPTIGASTKTDPLARGTEALQPLVHEESGKKFVRFDGVDDFLEAPAPVAGVPVTMTIVARLRELPLGGEKSDVWAGLSGGAGGGISTSSTGNPTIYGTKSLTLANAPIVANQWQVLTAVLSADGLSSIISRNELAPTVGDSGIPATIDRLRVGNLSGPGSNVNMPPLDVLRIVVWPKALTQAEVTQVNTALKATYGI